MEYCHTARPWPLYGMPAGGDKMEFSVRNEQKKIITSKNKM
jgi:hypothetical protein